MKYSATKRVLDIAAAGAGLIFALPIGLAAAAALMIENKGDVFFRQSRIGKDGKDFNIFKFNTMTEERDAQGRLLPEADRITPVGAVLRKYSINELPQLLNILKGDMAAVGPRPWTYQCCEYQQIHTNYPHMAKHMDTRTSVKPGLVCLHGAGVSNAAKKSAKTTEKHDWVRQLSTDNFYVQNQSLLMDLCIMKNAFFKAVLGRDEEIKGNNDLYTPKEAVTEPLKTSSQFHPAPPAPVPARNLEKSPKL